MRQETNNEMDVLLRRLGRRQDIFAPDVEDHLDADEMSAYAENALPVAARARYTQHLAECSKCRELVVQLGASAGVVSAVQTTKVTEPSAWRKFLANLVSPMVLRYAAPALGLIVITVIGVVVMRRDSARTDLAQLQSRETQQNGAVANTSVGITNEQTHGYVSAPPAGSTVDKEAQPKSLPQQEATPVPERAQVVEQNAPAPKPDSQPAATAAEQPRPAKVETATDEDQRKNADVSRKQQEEVKVAPSETSTANFELQKDANKRAEAPTAMRGRTAKSKSVADDGASPQGVTSTGSVQRDGVDRDKESSAETRSVEGRRFRKQGGIWTDTAYDSRDTVILQRNSERYRSVTADEPALKNIADQLDGEIIVVWKGRAYRIR
jgi:hypothetical protein